MTAQKINLYIEQGATFTLGFNWMFESVPPTVPPTAGLAHDLTGCTARMQIRQFISTTVLVSATTENGAIALGGVDGRVDVTLSEALTMLLTVAEAVYDLEIVYPSGVVLRVLQGATTNDPNVTRDAP
jgi:hypothetical protein